MKRIGLLLVVVLGLSGQSPMSTPATMHLVYQFGYNTPVATSGNGTGTTTVDIAGPEPDGGMKITGTDSWWNTVRPRAQNTCELYPDATVACTTAPWALTPMQLTIFPLLAQHFFKGLGHQGTGSFVHKYDVKAAIVPGATGMAGQQTTWRADYSYTGKGPVKGAASLMLVTGEGTLNQQGGHYLKATSKQRIVFDPNRHVPAIVNDVRTHFPQRSVYNNDSIQMKLIKVS
jgi:hypothetical protein